MPRSDLSLSANDVRRLIHEELTRLGVLPKAELKMGLPVVFQCSCGRARPNGCGELEVIPIKVNGEKRVDLVTRGIGGVVLDREQRQQLADILNEADWFGDRADLRP